MGSYMREVQRRREESTRGTPRFTDSDFEIQLVNEGRTFRHQVYVEMQVAKLIVEAAAIFRLDAGSVLLMLFSPLPVTLDRTLTLVGPPRVLPNVRGLV
jgi:hypothetical protein